MGNQLYHEFNAGLAGNSSEEETKFNTSKSILKKRGRIVK